MKYLVYLIYSDEWVHALFSHNLIALDLSNNHTSACNFYGYISFIGWHILKLLETKKWDVETSCFVKSHALLSVPFTSPCCIH